MTPRVAARDDLRTSRPAQPANPLHHGRLLHTRLLPRPRSTSAWVAQPTAARGTDHVERRDRTHTPYRPETGTRRRLALVGPNSCIARGAAERQSSPRRTRLRDLSSTDHAGEEGLAAAISRSGRVRAGPAGGCPVQRSRPPVRLGQVSELEASADVHHRRAPRGRGGHWVAAAVRRQRRVVGWWLSTGG